MSQATEAAVSYVVAKGYILGTVHGFAHGGQTVCPLDFASISDLDAALKNGALTKAGEK